MTFEPTRLRLARARRGMTKKQLSELSNVSPRTLSDLENGPAHVPSYATVEALARTLGFPREFFESDAVELPQPEAVSFRAMKSLTARRRDSALASSAIAIELSDWIEERFELPEVSVPDLLNLGPEEAAEFVRSEWGIGPGPLGNVIHLLEAHGVRVFSLAEECKEVDAFSLWRDGTPYVFLNTYKTAERSRMDAAHELGHLVLHHDYDRSAARELERDATTFASALLLPADSLIGRHSRFPALTELIESKKPWGVSATAYVYRLHALDQMSEWHFRNLFKTMSRLGYRTSEPNGIGRETSAVITQVLSHLRGRHISIDDLASEMRIDRTDLGAVLFGLTLVSIEGGTGIATSEGSHKAPRLRLVPNE